MVLSRGTKAAISQINMSPKNNYVTALVTYLFGFFLNDSSYLTPKKAIMAIMALLHFIERVVGLEKVQIIIYAPRGTTPKKRKGRGVCPVT